METLSDTNLTYTHLTAPRATGLVAELRRWIAEGRYAAGTRLAEETVAQDLGVSRTPVRLAFRTLAQEGLLESAGKRGFVVRAFSVEDVRCAVEVRGVLEGLAARRLCERGPDAATLAVFEQCLAEGDAVLGCVGCYRIEAMGAQLFSRIDGDQFVIRGLPLLAVLDYLRTRGFLPS